MWLSLSPSLYHQSFIHSFSLCCLSSHHCTLRRFLYLAFGPHMCLPSFCCRRALSFSLSLYLSFPSRLFLSLFLSLSDLSLCVCCLSCHHCDATVMVRCDIFLCLSFGHVSRLSAVGMLSVALFLSLSFSDSLSLSLSCWSCHH